jgi:hypothetical protein
MISLPQWIQGEVLEAWDEYVAQRAKDKKAMTARSMVARIKRLQELKDAGYDPLHCLDEAINGHWLDFYAPKDKPIEHKAGSAADKTQEMLKQREARGYTAPPAELRLVADRIRRAG